MKLFVIAGLIALSATASAQTCKYGLYSAYGEFITSVRTGNDRDCMKAVQACRNWKVWYVAPSDARCIHVVDDGTAVIDYIKYPDYDQYYGYTGSPYTRVPRTQPQTTTTTTTTVCDVDARGREFNCRELPSTTSTTPGYSTGDTTETCDYYDDGSVECSRRVCDYVNGAYLCWTETPDRPQTRPTPTPTPTPSTQPMPRPRPNPTTTTPTQPTRPNPTPTPTPSTQPMPQPRPNPTQPTNTNPTPVPTPTTTPAPTTTPSSDAIRAIEAGETVIFNSTLQMVVSIPSPNFYNLKPTNGRDRDIVKDVARQYIAVTRGCNIGFCANDSVINLATSSYAAVAGLEYDGQFVLKTVDGSNQMTFDVNASSLAWTKGCSPEAPGKVCIGNVVMKQTSRNNGYYTVVGIQLDGNVVIENNDAPKKLTLNVRPDSLIITR